MKDFINFYYGLKIDSIKQVNDYYTFVFSDDIYYLINYNQDIKRIYHYIDFSNKLSRYNIKSHIIVINKDNKYISTIDDNNYILLKIVSKNEEISIIDIYNYQKLFLNEKLTVNKNYLSWSQLWSTKNDYFETALNEIKIDNIIDISIDYYLGLSENAIMYYNLTTQNYNHRDYYLTWCHKRIYYPNMSINYLNPISYIYDYGVRDIAEYLKSAFFNDESLVLNELSTFLKICKLDNFNANLLFSRLLYPSYYFDILEKWINKKCSSNELIKIVEKQKQYEIFLKKAYQVLSEYALLFHIDYLI